MVGVEMVRAGLQHLVPALGVAPLAPPSRCRKPPTLPDLPWGGIGEKRVLEPLGARVRARVRV